MHLPYIKQPSISLGPITIHAFGVLVAIAMLVGMRVVRKRAVSQALDGHTADRLVTWILIGGFIGAHLVDRLVYFPAETLAEPIRLLRFWEGLSSFGGFVGAVCAAWIFFRRGQPETWTYLDAVAYGFPFGWIFGRLGCFLAFDHPGLPTRFFLGEDDGSGVVRHNLGLEEALYTVLIAALFYVLGRRKRPGGFFVGMLALLYAPVRFLFDFLRTRDVRYLGLTPGQWGALALLGVGVFLVLRAQKKGEAAASPLRTS
jgi:phosphatidylglycerol:prolipoprotein diacylglycerol transferase